MMIEQNDKLQYRALGILSDTIGAALGAGHDVARAIRRARDSGRKIDFFRRGRLFTVCRVGNAG